MVIMTATADAPTSSTAVPSGSRRRRLRPLGWLRTALATILAVGAGAATIVAVTLTWLGASVVDREGFAALSEELVLDQQLSDEIEAAATASAGDAVQGIDTGPLPFGGLLLDGVESVVTSVLQEYFGSQQYAEDWYAVLGETYDANLGAARSGAGAPEDLQVHVGPLVDRVESSLEERIPFGIDLDLRAQEALGGRDAILSLDDSGTGPVLDGLVAAADQAPLWWAGSAVAAIAALVLARHREWTLLGAGAGLLGSGLIVGGAAQGIGEDIVASPGLTDVARSVVDRVLGILLGGLDAALLPWLWTGAGLAAAGLLLILVRLMWRVGRGDRAATGPLAGTGQDSGREVFEA